MAVNNLLARDDEGDEDLDDDYVGGTEDKKNSFCFWMNNFSLYF
jgi:hypothetical protein